MNYGKHVQEDIIQILQTESDLTCQLHPGIPCKNLSLFCMTQMDFPQFSWETFLNF